MKVIQVTDFAPLEALRLVDLEELATGPRRGLDIGSIPRRELPRRLVVEGRYQVKPLLPLIPSKTGAGNILAAGECIAAERISKRVLVQLGYGSFAERLMVPAGPGAASW
ncbi:MAG: hypothetical protein GDA47_04500 [Rhodospirillales bacterium]|nr:hypothetical protein [Rhodospirillales bacterium]